MSYLNDPRVLFAAERTLLAWNRTSLALLAFGFVMERSGVLLRALRPDMPSTAQDYLTFVLGLAFIALSALTAIYASYQYRTVLKTLSPEELPDGYDVRWGMIVNVIVGILSSMMLIGLMIWARP